MRKKRPESISVVMARSTKDLGTIIDYSKSLVGNVASSDSMGFVVPLSTARLLIVAFEITLAAEELAQAQLLDLARKSRPHKAPQAKKK